MATVQQYIGYDNIVTINNVLATSAATGFPVTNLANPATNLKWKSDSTSEQYVTITNPTGAGINYIGIAAHNLSGMALDIEAQTVSGASWGTLPWAAFTPASNRPVLKVIAPSDFFAIRLKITPSGIKPQIGVIYLGSITPIERGVYVGHTPITYGRSIDEVNGMAESGDFLGRIIRSTTYSGSVRLSNITPAWYRSTFDPFVQACATKPFFYAWRLAEYAEEIGYCWFNGGVPVPENTGPRGMMGVSFKIEGQA